ncbi:beta-galactoside alpha-2,6-sialyltransferase [Branchiostoma belcheri]|nr:beta-galactoside alpha-2,6-sialyltransferase [Branchiostoma belcheri]
MVKGNREQVVTTGDGTQANKAMGDEQPQPLLPQTTDKPSRLRQEMSCKLKKNVPFSTITRTQAPKDKNKDVLPEESLEKLVHFNSCAVVSSSHALRVHTYGQEIDSHDAVLRFNCARTDKFEKFVGNRTDFRMINTLIPLRRPKFGQDLQAEVMRFCDTTRLCNKTTWSPSTGYFGMRNVHRHFSDPHLTHIPGTLTCLPQMALLSVTPGLVHYALRGGVLLDNTTHVYYYDENFVRPGGDRHSYNQERTYVKRCH